MICWRVGECRGLYLIPISLFHRRSASKHALYIKCADIKLNFSVMGAVYPSLTLRGNLSNSAPMHFCHLSVCCSSFLPTFLAAPFPKWYTGYTQKNGAVSKVNKKSISHLTRAQLTPSVAATVQVSHALPAVRFSCLLRGRGASFQDGVAAGKGFLCAPFWGVQICDYSAPGRCVFSKPCTKLTLHCNHRSGHLKTEHKESPFLLRRHLENWPSGPATPQ